MIVLIAIIVGAVCLDQLTKWLAVVYLQGEPSFPLWKDVLHFTFVKNEGAAMGMLRDHRWVFMVFSTVAILGILIYLFGFRPKELLIRIPLAMIAGGGIGNMIDRSVLGYVIDFIDCSGIGFPWVFNVADSFVTVGAGLMILYLVLDIIKETKQTRAAKATAEDFADVTEPTDSTETTESAESAESAESVESVESAESTAADGNVGGETKHEDGLE